MRRLLAALVLLSAIPAFATEDSTAPTLANLTITPTATDTSAGIVRVTMCMVASDDLSGIDLIEFTFSGSKTYSTRSFGWTNGCRSTNFDSLPTCNSGLTGGCYVVSDCVSSDDCSEGDGSTVETVVCNGSSWVVKTTTSNPTTICSDLQPLLPRHAPGGTYTIGVSIRDKVGNQNTYTGAALGTASISNTP